MKKLTYKEAYDKIIEAYFKDEIEPFNPTFCFCGTLCNGDKWYLDTNFPEIVEHRNHSGYTGLQLGQMEKALLDEVWEVQCKYGYDSKEYEDALFAGMCSALEVLKQIHKDRGENVEDFEFVKRNKVIYK